MVLQNLLLKFAFLGYGLHGPGRGKRVSSRAKHLEGLWDTPRPLLLVSVVFPRE